MSSKLKEERGKSPADRDRVIVRTSILGIVANVFLAAFKAMVGVLSGSIAILLDAVNNLSDAASSIITIVGTKLAGKEPDKKHPFGYGRIEYLSALIISLIVLYAGITSFTESVKKILDPSLPEYSTFSLVIIVVGVVTKIVLGRYVKSVGQAVHSSSLENSGEDATLDAVISASTLAAALIYMQFHISLEAPLGAVISLVIIKSGVEMIRDTLSQILGERGDADLAQHIKQVILSFPQVQGAYDLVLHNYGPDSYQGSVHVEVPDTYTANELDELLRTIQMKVYQECDVILTAIGVYSVNTKDPEAAAMWEKIRTEVLSVEYIRQMHAFYVNPEKKQIRFDTVVSFDAPDRKAVYQEVLRRVQEIYPEYTLEVAMDADFLEE